MKRSLATLIALMLMQLPVVGCIGDDEEEEETYSSDYPSGGESYDAGSGSEYSYSYTCNSYSSENRVDIVDGPCSGEQEYFAETFGCNDVTNFYSACRSFWGCLANNSSGEYVDGYQTKLDQCETYNR